MPEQRIRAANLENTLKDILAEYETEIVNSAIEAAVKEVAKESAKQLKKGGSYHDTGASGYTKGWKAETKKKSRVGYEATVYNSKAPGLAHLLEFGHAKQNGGRTRAYPHIAPVNDAVADKLIEKIQEELDKAS